MSLKAPVIIFTFYCQAIHAFKVGHLSLAFCFIIGLEAKVFLPDELHLKSDAFSIAQVCSTQHFPLRGQTDALIHLFSQENIPTLHKYYIFKYCKFAFY